MLNFCDLIKIKQVLTEVLDSSSEPLQIKWKCRTLPNALRFTRFFFSQQWDLLMSLRTARGHSVWPLLNLALHDYRWDVWSKLSWGYGQQLNRVPQEPCLLYEGHREVPAPISGAHTSTLGMFFTHIHTHRSWWSRRELGEVNVTDVRMIGEHVYHQDM